ncbi:MAG: Stealth CR1 domain-containing protein [Oscillospiraceae bacterium]|nr:Stealth CR1 domain-containing protein [Oscillospiraceae bacterium]
MKPRNQAYPIDIIITWVDGNDPKWLMEKMQYAPSTTSDDRASRYRDWETLVYLFRGIEQFAPWVNHVYLVTWGHTPKWLNNAHAKLKIINHSDYIPSKYLPTFNSHTIELNFHRIQELSEHFVYFNDDTFLIKPTKVEDFFNKGKPCDSAILTAISHKEDSFYCFSKHRAAGIMNKYFDSQKVIRSNLWGWYNYKYGKMILRSWMLSGFPRFTGIWQHHLPSSLCKSTMIELWKKEPEKLEQTCAHKFREMLDFNQWLFKCWQLATGNFYPRSVNFGKSFILDNQDIFSDALSYIKKQNGKVICINDPNDYVMSDEAFGEAKIRLIQSLDSILPNQSAYEM